ncbi:hypothetical protein GCM10009119_06970 [Algoriphagus jejuensis]|uniref:TIR domain-containing protein n=1 Tax=Algoriphagus jejuensis TaxID=419934 RepID=A0ABP3Y873_9BACT
MSTLQNDVPQTRVFLSYSRKDIGFVMLLAKQLNELGILTDFDQSDSDPDFVTTGISAEDEWWKRLEEMISEAAVIIFVISPDSAYSKVCGEEIALAQTLGKRVIPLLLKPIDFNKVPPRLSAYNIKIDFSDEHNHPFDETVIELVRAIETDVEWLRTGVRITAIAKRWLDQEYPNDLLLRGEELYQAEAWAVSRPRSVPEISTVILDFLSASRDKEVERNSISSVEKARYLELIRIMQPFLKKELSIRESQPLSDHRGVANEMQTEIEIIRSLLNLENRWHPDTAVYVQSTGAIEGYAEIFKFPCCGQIVKDFSSTGDGDPPSQFRANGCQEIPKKTQHEYLERTNPFWSILVSKYKE